MNPINHRSFKFNFIPKSITVALCFYFTACNCDGGKANKRLLDFGLFTIETPCKWEKVKERGIDSYVGRIAIDKKDTIDFDLGWYSNTLTETDPEIIDRSLLKNFGKSIDTSQYIIVDDHMKVDLDKYKKNNVSWDTIDGRLAKIVYPRRHGIGITGIYIDSLWSAGDYRDRFNLYGENLTAANEQAVLQAFKTVKFYKHKK